MEIYIKEDILINFIFEKKKIPYDNIIITMKKNRCWHRRVMKKKPSRNECVLSTARIMRRLEYWNGF